MKKRRFEYSNVQHSIKKDKVGNEFDRLNATFSLCSEPVVVEYLVCTSLVMALRATKIVRLLLLTEETRNRQNDKN